MCCNVSVNFIHLTYHTKNNKTVKKKVPKTIPLKLSTIITIRDTNDLATKSTFGRILRRHLA